MEYTVPAEPRHVPDAKAAFLHAVRLRETAAEAARLLAGRGLAAVALKGVALAAYGAPPPGDRHSADVDLLVARPRLDEAADVLRAAGWSGGDAGVAHGIARSLAGHPRHAPVDLHGELLNPGRASLPGADVLLRARPAPGWLPAPLLVPDPLDLFAHLAAHAAYNLVVEGRRHHPEDLPRLATALHLDDDRLAAHLRRTGLATSAAVVLACSGLPAGHALESLQARLGLPPAAVVTIRRVLETPPHSLARRALHLLLADHPVEALAAGLRRRTAATDR